MPELRQQIADRASLTNAPQTFAGYASKDAAGSTVDVVLYADGQEYDKCPVMPRGEDLPAQGDSVWASIDDSGDAIVVCWIPA
jgi:hypothetical protein